MSQPAEALNRLAEMQQVVLDWWGQMVEVIRERSESLTPEDEGAWGEYFERLGELVEKKAKTRHIYLPADLVEHVVAGYRRVLVERAYRASPEDPALTKEAWERLPDRWFDEQPAS